MRTLRFKDLMYTGKLDMGTTYYVGYQSINNWIAAEEIKELELWLTSENNWTRFRWSLCVEPHSPRILVIMAAPPEQGEKP